MVAGKVKAAMGFQQSPARPKPETPKHVPAKAPPKTFFSRSFGVYFPRSSAQVQPRPPDVSELIRIVEECRERESRLHTELLQHKILKETASIVPFLEHEISLRDAEIENFSKKIASLEAERDLQGKIEEERRHLQAKFEEERRDLQEKFEEERRDTDRKVKEMEEEIKELKKSIMERNRGESKGLCKEISKMDECSTSQRFQMLIDAAARSNLLKSLKNGSKLMDTASIHDHKPDVPDLKRDEVETERSLSFRFNAEEISEVSESSILTVKSGAPRVPKPPPRPSSSHSSSSILFPTSDSSAITETEHSTEKKNQTPISPPPVPAPPRAKGAPPPPPPPPPLRSKGLKLAPAKVRRVPEVVEFYHSLTRRDSRRDSGTGVADVPTADNTRNMIGEIENRSTHLLAIKRDVETQGDFIRFLIKEVNNAAFTEIEDVVPFVKWLDDELSYLVDERAVLKHFEWPEQKADALREAAFGYSDLKKLESDTLCFRDDIRQPCCSALKKMQALLEKLEHGVSELSRTRESASKRYKKFNIPSHWMLETGFVSQIKLASVKLAMKYMKRVSAELEALGGGPEEEELMLQGVRFAFRVHQFAGGFDVETMKAFQELRKKARSCHIQCENQKST